MDWAPSFAVGIAVCIASITDVRSLKVHNWLTLPAITAGIVYHSVTAGLDGFQTSLLNVVVVFGILLVPYMLGAIGAGDVKLVAVVGAWLGTPATLAIAAVGLFATGIYSLVLLSQQRRLSDAWLHFKLSAWRLQMVARHLGSDDERVHELAKSPEGRKRLVPFSVMLAIGSVVVMSWSIWWN